jgi:micrococcal nuclease
MIASKPARALSLAIVAAVILAGARGIAGGIGFSGDLLERARGTESAASRERTPGVVAYALDGDTVQVTTRSGRNVRVRFLGIIH